MLNNHIFLLNRSFKYLLNNLIKDHYFKGMHFALDYKQYLNLSMEFASMKVIAH